MKYFNLIFLLSLSFAGIAMAASDKEIIEKFIPPQFIIDHTGARNPVGSELIYSGETHRWIDLDGKNSAHYLVVGYRADSVEGSSEMVCNVVVIKDDGKKLTLMDSTLLQIPDEVSGCFEINSYDLDNNKKPEIVVTRILGKEDGPPAILKWDGKKLISITPVTVFEGIIQNAFEKIAISPDLIHGKRLIRDISTNLNAPKKIYAMVDGRIVLQESHVVIRYIEGNSKTPTVLNESIPAGDYILEVKNLSPHKRTVRADITVNGVVVLKPIDFCKYPRSSIGWMKKVDDDDDDDNDDDKNKRCEAKVGIYAQIKVTGPLQIIVKVFGKKNSKISLTIDKK